ncbi:MAG TPA: hypothetical protein VGD67_05730, partial [Pseudonocardiaceae bacterium]
MTEQTFRTARVFDGAAMDGRPHVDRQMLEEREAGLVLSYLESAPVVHSTGGFSLDRIDPMRGKAVPVTWHTDGTWVWPGSVTYYLRSYALPPDPEFLAHIRQRNFRPPAVDAETRQTAHAIVSRSDERPGGGPIEPSTSPSGSASASPGGSAASASAVSSTSSTSSPSAVSAASAASASAGAAAPAAPVSDPAQDSANFDRLRSAAADLGVPKRAYRIGAGAEGAWSVLREGSGWSVFRSERGARHHRVIFETSQQATAYLIGQLYLARPAAEEAPASAVSPASGPAAAPVPAAVGSAVSAADGPGAPAVAGAVVPAADGSSSGSAV